MPTMNPKPKTKHVHATKSDLRKEICELRITGNQMANLCFKLAQDPRLPERYRTMMDELCKQWDGIKRREHS